MKETDHLGDGKCMYVRVKTRYDKKDKKKYLEQESDLLADVIDYFKSNETVFSDNSWLRNALRYFYFGARSERPEDKLINMIVSLESLFLEGEGELSYRLSLRGATLIGNVFDDKTTEEVFDDFRKLYGKRCGVVHGGITEVTHNDIFKLETYIRRAINTFVRMLQSMGKKDILRLLDHSLVSKGSVNKLKEILQEEKAS